MKSLLILAAAMCANAFAAGPVAPVMPTAIKPSIFGEATPAARQAAMPLKSVLLSGIDFGGFVSGAQPGTVTITPQGERSGTGGVILIKSKQGRPGLIQVTGILDAPYSLRALSSAQMKPIFLTDSGVLTAGSVTVPIGGTLTVPANARNTAFVPPPLSISVNYQ